MSSSVEPSPDEPAGRSRHQATRDEARALASPLRLRILRVCLGEARTNKEIADALGRDPATVLHHVRTLADTGFLQAQPARRGVRGSREIPYLATGKSWTVSTPGSDLLLLETFVEEVGLVPAESVSTIRMGFRFSAAERAEFETRLMSLVEEFMARATGGETEPWSFFMALHPDPNRH